MEPARRRRRPGFWVGVVALLALAASTALDFVHTDDGGAVKRHCRACRVACLSRAPLLRRFRS